MILMCTLRTHQSTTCGFHLRSPCCDCSVIFPPECPKTSRIKNSVLRFQCWVSAHPPWPHRPAHTRTTHRAQCSEIPRFFIEEFSGNWTTELEGKAIKRKVIRPSPLWWSSFYQQCRASRSAPRANHKAGCFQSCVLSPSNFFQSRGNVLCVCNIPSDTLGGKRILVFTKRA